MHSNSNLHLNSNLNPVGQYPPMFQVPPPRPPPGPPPPAASMQAAEPPPPGEPQEDGATQQQQQLSRSLVQPQSQPPSQSQGQLQLQSQQGQSVPLHHHQQHHQYHLHGQQAQKQGSFPAAPGQAEPTQDPGQGRNVRPRLAGPLPSPLLPTPLPGALLPGGLVPPAATQPPPVGGPGSGAPVAARQAAALVRLEGGAVDVDASALPLSISQKVWKVVCPEACALLKQVDNSLFRPQFSCAKDAGQSPAVQRMSCDCCPAAKSLSYVCRPTSQPLCCGCRPATQPWSHVCCPAIKTLSCVAGLQFKTLFSACAALQLAQASQQLARHEARLRSRGGVGDVSAQETHRKKVRSMWEGKGQQGGKVEAARCASVKVAQHVETQKGSGTPPLRRCTCQINNSIMSPEPSLMPPCCRWGAGARSSPSTCWSRRQSKAAWSSCCRAWTHLCGEV